MCNVTSKSSLSPSLESLVEAASGNDLKFVFCGGKGGVGKTTSSSAIATLLTTVCKKRILLISTDPAHSLGDAWRTKFSNVPTSPMKNLHVMEVDPKETLSKELESWSNHIKHLYPENEDDNDDDSNNPLSSISKFQDWLTGIPGIDEATALSSAMSYIESGEYDIIVFDTAPTGHTLKLLALPALLEKGISQLQSWSSKIWGYWETFKGFTSGGTTKNINIVKEEVAKKLINYKASIQKVATLLQDQTRTRFVVICIAEFLSISETKRLLQELKKNQIRASHVIVNQLVIDDALSREELSRLESMAEVGDLNIDPMLLKKTIHACQLTTARKEIQQKYLDELISFEASMNGILEGLCQVPLLSLEPTGNDAILQFSKLLLKDVATDEVLKASEQIVPVVGDTVRIMQLEKSPHFNGCEGKVISKIDDVTGRVGVAVRLENTQKKLALLPKNLSIVRASTSSPSKKKKKQATMDNEKDSAPVKSNTVPNSIVDKAMKILEDDPEIKEMSANNPRVKEAIEDCSKNPMNAIKYISDPELSPLISKIMSKLQS